MLAIGRSTQSGLFLLLITASAYGQDWIPLFDGQSFAGWTSGDGSPVTAEAWEVVDGMIHLDTAVGRGGNIVTDREYGDFELVFEWKIADGSNNGIKYRVKQFDGRMLGCEYQIIDDPRHPDLGPTHRTASLYDVYEPRPHRGVRPAGQFNRGAIVVRQNRIEHWLNGYLVVEATVGSAEWERRIAKSKFSDVKGFGKSHYGRIMLTDHNDEVWYRNIFLRRLSTDTHLIAARSQCRVHSLPTCQKRKCVRPLLRLVARRGCNGH